MAQVGPGRGVDRGERLVQQEHGRLDGEGPGQGDALGLPTRQLSRPTGRGVGQPDPFEPQCRGAPGFMLRYAATGAEAESHVFQRAEMRKQAVLLEDDADVALLGWDAYPGGSVLDDGAVQYDATTVKGDQAGQGAHQRRLPGAVGTDHRDHGVVADIKVDVEIEFPEPQADRSGQRHRLRLTRSGTPPSKTPAAPPAPPAPPS